MDELSRRIGTLSMTKVSNGKERVSSVTKVIKEMNRTLNEDNPDYYVIPDDQKRHGNPRPGLLRFYKDLHAFVMIKDKTEEMNNGSK